jgi:hypothetical protein
MDGGHGEYADWIKVLLGNGKVENVTTNIMFEPWIKETVPQ